MNIALTYNCNQNCPYCFAKDAMSLKKDSAAAREITMDNLGRIMDFMKRAKAGEFCMIGGEPTLHSRFEEIYDVIEKNGFLVTIFSNGVISSPKVDHLAGKGNLSTVLLNVRQPEEYRKEDWAKIIYCLSRLNNKIILSFRIYRLDFDPRFMFDLIDKYKLRRLINWAMACPSLVRSNRYLPIADHGKAVRRMVKFSRESKIRRILWYSDAGFIWCAFSQGKAEALYENVGFKPMTNCVPAVEVAPDLRVFRCYGMAAKTGGHLKITDFRDLEEAERYFLARSLPLKRIGCMDKCFQCEHIISQKCGGGCMVHIIKKIPGHRGLSPFF